MKITFLGAVGTVTGSKYLIEHNRKRVLVDCGLFQGYKELRLRNWAKLPVNPSTIDAVILTHAHIDHSGYIPLLVKNGFKGHVYCSKATYDLCSILLPDSGYLHEQDAYRANRYGYTKHHPALPLYSQKDAKHSLQYFKTVDFDTPYELAQQLRFTLNHAGHILGASFVTLSDTNTTIVFSGDLGRLHDPLMKAPTQLQKADYIVIESTYGNRLHSKTDPAQEISEVVNSTVARGGSIIIPAFAVGRAQSVLYYLHQLKQANQIPEIPVFLDSPMAINATELLCKYADEHRLSRQVCGEVCDTAQYVREVEDSKSLDHSQMPMIIISASGMATGGRVLHHLKHFITDHRNTILFTGFQAGGTRGDRLIRGEQEIKIHGAMHQVNARIENLDSLSAHADYEEILQWLDNFSTPPRKVFITHGGVESSAALQEKIQARFGWNAVTPQYLQSEEL